jgi:hypothetical protein
MCGLQMNLLVLIASVRRGAAAYCSFTAEVEIDGATPTASVKAAAALHSTHVLLRFLWTQRPYIMPASIHSLHFALLYLSRPCGQMLLPPHSLHWYLILPCVQRLLPPQSLHLYLSLPCVHMPLPPHSLHLHLTFPCSQMLLPLHSLH